MNSSALARAQQSPLALAKEGQKPRRRPVRKEGAESW